MLKKKYQQNMNLSKFNKLMAFRFLLIHITKK